MALAAMALYVSHEFDTPLEEIHDDPTHLIFHVAYEASQTRAAFADRRGESSQRWAAGCGAYNRRASHEQRALLRKHLRPPELTMISDRGTFSVGHLLRRDSEKSSGD